MKDKMIGMAHLHGIAGRNLIVGETVEFVRKLTPADAAALGWSGRPAMLFLSNNIALLPVRDMDGDEGGVMWNHAPFLLPGPSFCRVRSGKRAEGAWLEGRKIRDVRPLGKRELDRFDWRNEPSPVSGLFMDDGSILVPCRGERWNEGPGELLAIRPGPRLLAFPRRKDWMGLAHHLLVLPEGPKDWTPR